MTPEDKRLVLGALAGDKQILQSLPADSPLRLHLPQAEEALKAYCQGNDEAVEASLSRIPYRSPYRDLRFLLKALLCYPQFPGAGRAALDRIGLDSPLKGPAEVVRALLTGQLKGLKPLAREFVRAIAGKIGGKAQPKQIFSTLLAEAKKHPDTPGLQQALSALLAYYPAGKSAYAKVYGTADSDELLRMSALLAEQDKELDKAMDQWEALFHRYREAGKKLEAAMVRFHMVNILEKANYPHLDVIEELLDDTVSLDPELRDAWLKLAEMKRTLEDERGRGRVLDKALTHFPQDPKVLDAAAEAAIDRGAFKKAARLTKQLLKLDPINRRARKRLLYAHMRHARKQAKSGKFDLAAKEIEQARQWARDPEEQGRVAVLEELISFLRGEVFEPGFQQAQTLLSSPFLECVVAAEVLSLGFPPKQSKPYLKQLRQVLDHRAMTMDKTTVAKMVDLLMELNAEGVQMDELMKTVRPFLKKGTKLDWGEQERIALLEKLFRLEQYQLVRDYARASPEWKKKPGQRDNRPPALVYFDVVAKSGGEPGALSYSDVKILEDALEHARQIQQHRWASRIDKLLDDFEESQSIAGPMPGAGINPFAILEQLSKETGIPLEELVKEVFEGGDGKK